MCGYYLRCSSTCDMLVCISILQWSWQRPCLPDVDQEMENYVLLRISNPCPCGKIGFLWDLRCYTLLTFHPDSLSGLRFLLGRNLRRVRPSVRQNTCFHTPSPYLPPPWTTGRRLLRQQLSWGHCSCFWLCDSRGCCFVIFGMRRWCHHVWIWGGRLVSVPVFLVLQMWYDSSSITVTCTWQLRYSHYSLLRSWTQICSHYKCIPCGFPLEIGRWAFPGPRLAGCL